MSSTSTLRLSLFLGGTLVALAAHAAAASVVPDYRLGDVAADDVVTPVALQVVNPDATEALRQKVAAQVHPIVRYTPQTAQEAEQALRASVAEGRKVFLATLQQKLGGRAPNYGDLDTPAFVEALRDSARDLPKEFPLEKLAAVWVRELSDETFSNALVRALRDVMLQPVMAAKSDGTPASQPVRLLSVTGTETPAARDLETKGKVISSSKILTLWRARRLVETYFPAGQEDLGRFAATFVRTNATADAALTEIARAQRTEGLTVNDTYEAAQAVVRKGQVIDRKALSALALLREKSVIATLQTKLADERTATTRMSWNEPWLLAAIGVGALLVMLSLVRLRSRNRAALVVRPADLAVSNEPFQSGGLASAGWESRALASERRDASGRDAMRSGVLGWMKDVAFRTMFRHREELMSAQQKAEAEMRGLEERLEQLHAPLQERIATYEKRIADLERDLAVKGEENRELIAARINFAKQQLATERERVRFEAN